MGVVVRGKHCSAVILTWSCTMSPLFSRSLQKSTLDVVARASCQQLHTSLQTMLKATPLMATPRLTCGCSPHELIVVCLHRSLVDQSFISISSGLASSRPGNCDSWRFQGSGAHDHACGLISPVSED